MTGSVCFMHASPQSFAFKWVKNKKMLTSRLKIPPCYNFSSRVTGSTETRGLKNPSGTSFGNWQSERASQLLRWSSKTETIPEVAGVS